MIDDIIDCMNVISDYNPNMRSLYNAFVDQAPLMENNIGNIENSEEIGQPIYEALIFYQLPLANAIHDYVYNVIRPFDSVMVKNKTREQVCREAFGLTATFE